MKRWGVLCYGVACYAVFFGVFLYLAGFLGNFLVPRTMDSPAAGSVGLGLLVNLGLIALFGIQHSVMARPTFKRWWTQFVPKPIERSTYVMATNVALILMFCFWQPTGMILWDVESPVLRGVVHAIFALGFLTVLVTTFLINHFDLFGLRQVWLYFRGREYQPIRFRNPGPYRFVRHPLYVGWLLAFWATPTMSLMHFVFAAGMTGYILIAIVFEERNLAEEHGEAYEQYRRTTPMLIPRFSTAATPSTASEASAPTGSA